MLKHIIRTQDFNQDFLDKIYDLTWSYKYNLNRKEIRQHLLGKVVSVLFYEPSLRTRFSFESAVVRLGATKISSENAAQFSSAAKGESLRDTIRVMSGYSDCIVLRHKERGSAQEAAQYSDVPIINAGDGDGQHPTQSLLDWFTIKEHIYDLDGRTILLAGDLRHSRTVHSLAYLLAKHEDVRFFLASPQGLEMPDDILEYLDRNKAPYFQFDSLVTAVRTGEVDVVYHTRPQKERYLSRDTLVTYEECKENFTLTWDLAEEMKKHAIILHPLPRNDEIRYKVDKNPRAKYFEQARNGLYVRMALLIYLLGR